CSTMLALLGRNADADGLFDRAVAQRVLPATLAAAPIDAAVRLKDRVRDMPLCRALLEKQSPVSL
ncbi:MAG: hypothetical protein IJ646_11380, partial [Clostridia bacterium]|nr:hypothetical protein [Clostridia bacterium]